MFPTGKFTLLSMNHINESQSIIVLHWTRNLGNRFEDSPCKAPANTFIEQDTKVLLLL